MYKNSYEGVEWCLDYEMEENFVPLIIEMEDEGYLFFDVDETDEEIFKKLKEFFPDFSEEEFEKVMNMETVVHDGQQIHIIY